MKALIQHPGDHFEFVAVGATCSTWRGRCGHALEGWVLFVNCNPACGGMAVGAQGHMNVYEEVLT